jgi:hypothetical protein
MRARIEALHLPKLLMDGEGRLVAAEMWAARRKELLEMYEREVYGATPPACAVVGTVAYESDSALGGKAIERDYHVELRTELGQHSYPVKLYVPKTPPLRGTFVHITDMVGEGARRVSPHCPVEELVDEGYAIAHIGYTDIAGDDDDFGSGIAPLFPRDANTGWGKIGMWAYGMSRAVDVLETVPEIKGAPLIAVGYSRLGKTALWCAAQDERIACAFPGGSGTGGAAIFRQNPRESLDGIARAFPHWFCGNFASYIGREDALPVDQHMLIALCAPRKVYIAAAEGDAWADPDGEYIACKLADEVYRLLTRRGFVAPDELPTAPAQFHMGDVGYHLRPGTHFMSRYDWRKAIEFLKRRFK